MKIDDLAGLSNVAAQNVFRERLKRAIEFELNHLSLQPETEAILETIRDAHSMIEQYETEIQELKNKIKQQKQIANDAALRLSPIICNENGTASLVATYLYWSFPEIHRESVFQLETNLSPVGMNIEYSCPRCKGVYTLHYDIKSRSNLRYSMENIFRTANSLCPDCEEQKYTEIRAILEASRQIRADRLNELKTMPYNEYLQTDEWKDTRRKALKRARFKCELCHSGSELQVHHKTYERRGEEDNKDLIVLCRNCHAKFHDKLQEDE